MIGKPGSAGCPTNAQNLAGSLERDPSATAGFINNQATINYQVDHQGLKRPPTITWSAFLHLLGQG